MPSPSDKRADERAWIIAVVLWLLGVAALWVFWDAPLFKDRSAQAVFDTALYVIAFFWILALYPIRHFILDRLTTHDDPPE